MTTTAAHIANTLATKRIYEANGNAIPGHYLLVDKSGKAVGYAIKKGVGQWYAEAILEADGKRYFTNSCGDTMQFVVGHASRMGSSRVKWAETTEEGQRQMKAGVEQLGATLASGSWANTFRAYAPGVTTYNAHLKPKSERYTALMPHATTPGMK